MNSRCKISACNTICSKVNCGFCIVLGIFALLISISFFIWNQNNKSNLTKEVSSMLAKIAYMNPGQNSKKEEILKTIVSDYYTNYTPFAKLRLADIYIKQENVDLAMSTYKEIADDKSYPDSVRDFATYYLLEIILNNMDDFYENGIAGITLGDKISKINIDHYVDRLIRPNSALIYSGMILYSLLLIKHGDYAKVIATIGDFQSSPQFDNYVRDVHERSQDNHNSQNILLELLGISQYLNRE